MFNLAFEPKMDLGHFLTFLTLVAGFLWWLYTSVRSWRQKSDDEARSGALRLLLKILRDQQGRAISIEKLMGEFHSPENKDLRKAYCRRDYRFKDVPSFEAALYRLDWEGKVDFPSPHEVIFRVDSPLQHGPIFLVPEQDKTQMLKVLKDATNEEEVTAWDIERMAESRMRAAPSETTELIREKLHSSDPRISRRVVHVLSRLLPTRA